MPLPQKKPVTGYLLKYIAMVSMVLDHINMVVIRHGIYRPWMLEEGYYCFDTVPSWFSGVHVLYRIFDILGHMAFPLYAFLLAEGFIHTRSRRRYLLTLLTFALLSEPIYNLAHYQSFFGAQLQNVLFTLTIACGQLWLLSLLEKKQLTGFTLWAWRTAILIGAGGLALAIRSEYVFLGTLACALFYLLRHAGAWRLLGLLPLTVVSPWILLDTPLLFFYGGQRGRRGRKYFFYLFYPVHFLLLMGLAALAANFLTHRYF